jgi:tetratricopeptide (TPR) repeat protein
LTSSSTSVTDGGGAHAAADDFERAARALHPDRSRFHPRLHDAIAQLEHKRFAIASKLLDEYLRDHPRDANARYLQAETAMRQGRVGEVEALLARCVKLAPDFRAARFRFANTLLQANKPEAALAEAEELLKQEPGNPLFRQLKALALEAAEDFTASAALWRELVGRYPTRQDCWLRYGHSLRGAGSREECIAAYRSVIALNPANGDAWWSLADLKTFRFGEAEIERMESQFARSELSASDRCQLRFSLGKAYADLELYEKSFGNYAEGNALQRRRIKHDPDVLTSHVARCKALFTGEFFRDRIGSGCGSAEPIFLVGMPRAGSTLVEQILASHSQVEGTRELFELAAISRHLQTEIAAGTEYFAVLQKLDPLISRQLGERYLQRAGIHRKLGRNFFTDKMGANYIHIGLLQLILPNAKIVDVRRHPLACGFSIFAQLFPKGQNDSYRLADIGHTYRDYVELMAHFDRALPGKVHRVFYENLVVEPELEIRRLLDYLNLPFEPACLAFHRNNRIVTTASSEQVRTPIYRHALEQWRHYEAWLGPLKDALGPSLEGYGGGGALD